jgi:hypothetical protein
MKKIRAHRGSSLVEHPSAWTAHTCSTSSVNSWSHKV